MNGDLETDLERMQLALQQALDAAEAGEVPVGAVIFEGNRLVAKAHNQVETLKDPTAHAEILAITQACADRGAKWLQGCTLYVTLEPCSMCAGAIQLGRFDRVVYAASDPKTGACGSRLDVLAPGLLNHDVRVTGGILAEPCGHLIRDFFRARRG